MEFTNSCWNWIGSKNNLGYGQFWVISGKQRITAHRFSYQFFFGIPDTEKVVHHICRNRLCVNPDHLDLITQRENKDKDVRKTCKKCGNKVEGKNVLIIKNGYESKCCRFCWNKRVRDWKRKQTAKGIDLHAKNPRGKNMIIFAQFE